MHRVPLRGMVRATPSGLSGRVRPCPSLVTFTEHRPVSGRRAEYSSSVDYRIRKPAGIAGRTCSVDGCERKHQAKGFCVLHHGRWLRHGDPLVTLFRSTCTVDGCEGKHRGHGLCDMHYQRVRSGHLEPLPRYRPPFSDRICMIDGCERKHKAKGLCDYHFHKVRFEAHDRSLEHWKVDDHRQWEREKERVAAFLNQQGVVSVQWGDIGNALMYLWALDHGALTDPD